MKKTVFIIAAFMLNSTAFAAVNAHSSWKKILRSDRHHAEIPTIIFNGLTWVSATNVCYLESDEGTMIATKKKFNVCLGYSSGGDVNICERRVRKRLIKPQVTTKKVCVEYSAGDAMRCLKYGRKTVTQPLSMKIDVFHAHETGDDTIIGSHAFSKTLHISSCR